MRACRRCGLIYSTGMEFCGLDGGILVETAIDLLVGRTIGRHRIVSRIGMGGVAAVYRAQHEVLGTPVAIKVLLGEMACRQIVAERFRREAYAMSKIVHPNVVRIVDFGVSDNGITYQAMELIEGPSLAEVIRGGPLDPERARRIAIDIARGLGAAHRLGYVHRDLKPSNVMLAQVDGRETAKILDFGLVGLTAEDPQGKLTQQGVVVGTPHYMAPETISSESLKPTADIYALGVTLYEMLSGHPPFEGDTLQEILAAHAKRPPPPLASTRDLQQIVSVLLAKDPSERPPNGDAVAAMLERGRSTPRKRSIAWIAAPVLVAIAALVGAQLVGTHPEEIAAERIEPKPQLPTPPPAPEPNMEPVRAPVPPPKIEPSPERKAQRPKRAQKRKKRDVVRAAAVPALEVMVDSDPPGAEVRLEGAGILGKTPMSALLPTDRDAVLVVEDERGRQKRVRWRGDRDRVMVRF